MLENRVSESIEVIDTFSDAFYQKGYCSASFRITTPLLHLDIKLSNWARKLTIIHGQTDKVEHTEVFAPEERIAPKLHSRTPFLYYSNVYFARELF